MPGEKRASSSESDAETFHKAAKISHTDNAATKTKQTRQPISKAAFREEALPIHVHLTHTPSPLIDDEDKTTLPSDPGHIGAVTLLPTDFSTGSYGWKGARRLIVELQGSEGGKKIVQVMLNINATVLGSKDAPEHHEEKSASPEK